jgi:Icc-related predicted phosphoesterase
VSHGPPLGFLDVGGYHNKNLGSFALKEKVLNMPDLKLMAFGHIHECGNKEVRYKDTLLVNAALLDFPAYDMIQKPTVVNINE